MFWQLLGLTVPFFLVAMLAQFLPGLLILFASAFKRSTPTAPIFPLTLIGLLLLLTQRGTWRVMLLTALVATAIGPFLNLGILHALLVVGGTSALISWERLHRRLHP